VILTSRWALLAALFYMLLFSLLGTAITALLTDLQTVRLLVASLMPLVIALPLVSVWCYKFDGVFIGATAALPMMVTMGLAFVVYLLVLNPLTTQWGLWGLWLSVLLFMGTRGLCQAIWYPWLERKLA
jgi:MATE family multidrug resistance protein